MRAGLMRNRITVLAATASTSPLGDVTYSWSSTAIGKLWAQVETAEGTERFESGAERTELPTIFRLRYRTDIGTNHRIQWPSTSDIYDIESVVNVDGRDTVIEIKGVKRG